jgi:hypothetical protein
MAGPTPIKKTPTKAGGRLNKKVGPLPLKYWIPIAAGVLLILWLYFRNKGGNTIEGEGATALLPYSATVTPQQAASAGTPSANSPVSSQLSPEVLAALGIGMPTNYVTGSDLQSQLDSLGSNVASQIAAATFVTTPSATTTKDPVKTPAAVKTATGAPVKKTNSTSKTAPVKYFTFAPGKAPKGRKADEIKAIAGKSIKFRKGSGYYYG